MATEDAPGIFPLVFMKAQIQRIFLTRHLELRVPWRIVLFLALASVMAAGLSLLWGWLSVSVDDPAVWILSLALLAASFVMTRFVNKKPLKAVGLDLRRGSLREFGLGCFLGTLMMGGIFLVELSLGYVVVTSRGLSGAEVLLLLCRGGATLLLGALAEELLFRGYPFQTLIQGITFLPAAVAASAIFACAHLLNPHIGLLAFTNIVLAGLWLSFAYMKTRTLWLPLGLHFSWNFTQSVIFSFPTSGIHLPNSSLLTLVQGGPEWITGSAFGPEGGVLATVSIILATVHLLRSSLYRQRSGVVTLDSLEDLLPEAAEGDQS